MSTNRVARPSSAKVVPLTTSATNVSDVLQQYGCGRLRLSGRKTLFMNGTWFLTERSIQK